MKTPPIETLDAEDFTSKLAKETDRACAVLGAAWLDARLEELLRRRLKHDVDELLRPGRALQSFSARIRLARSLCWIDEATGYDLDTIRTIRNDFAHSFDHSLGFESQSIAARCRTLRSANAYLDGTTEAAKHQPNFSTHVFERVRSKLGEPRWRFQIAVEFIEQILQELPELESRYSGPDLCAEVFKVSAAQRFHVRATLTVGDPVDTKAAGH